MRVKQILELNLELGKQEQAEKVSCFLEVHRLQQKMEDIDKRYALAVQPNIDILKTHFKFMEYSFSMKAYSGLDPSFDGLIVPSSVVKILDYSRCADEFEYENKKEERGTLTSPYYVPAGEGKGEKLEEHWRAFLREDPSKG